MGKEQNRLVLAATSVVLLLLLAWFYAAFFASDVTPSESWIGKQQLLKYRDSRRHGNKLADKAIEIRDSLEFLLGRLVRGEDRIQLDSTGFSCHIDFNSELCVANRPVRIDNNALTVYIQSSQSQIEKKVKPYPDKLALESVTPVQIVSADDDLPACHFTHDVPAVVFSSGGFTGNQFHEFNELIIPLFITSHHFRSNVKLVNIDYKPWWVSKYSKILSLLSRYEVINPAADGKVHCFPGAVIGLKYHGFLALNNTDIPGGYSMFDFKQFLRESYNLKINNVYEINREKPILVLISRGKSRKFLNEDEMVVMMEELGFHVVVTRPNRMSNLNKFAEVLNSCSVLVGAHGAGLTTELFLPTGAAMVQVVPLGLEWASTYYFGSPAREMGVQYLEYKIEPAESSLIETYDRDHPVFTDPASLFAEGYFIARAVYIDGQNLKINLTRFRKIIVQAMELIGMSSHLN